MKHFLSIVSFLCCVSSAQAQYEKIFAVLRFDNLVNEVKEGYGTLEQPLESGAFINLMNAQLRNAAFVRLFNSYRWPNGQKIDFSKRGSTKGGSKGIVDRYILVNPETSDTVFLYVDPYQTSSKYYVPKGMVALTPNLLKTEIDPILQQIEEINQAEEGSKLILHAGDVMRYISANFDQHQLIDSDKLKPLVDDKTADKSLVGYLMRSYIFNKYYALAKDIDNAGDYAFAKMKKNFEKYMKFNPEANTGQLKAYLQ
jgi:hypothetical protein